MSPLLFPAASINEISQVKSTHSALGSGIGGNGCDNIREIGADEK